MEILRNLGRDRFGFMMVCCLVSCGTILPRSLIDEAVDVNLGGQGRALD